MRCVVYSLEASGTLHFNLTIGKYSTLTIKHIPNLYQRFILNYFIFEGFTADFHFEFTKTKYEARKFFLTHCGFDIFLPIRSQIPHMYDRKEYRAYIKKLKIQRKEIELSFRENSSSEDLPF